MNNFGLIIAAFVCLSSFVLLVGLLFTRLAVRSDNPAPPSPTGPARAPRDATLLKPKNTIEQLGERLIQAGLYRRNSKTLYYFSKAVLICVPIAVWSVAAVAGLLTFRTALLYGILTAIAGTVFPSLWLDMKKKKRQAKLRRCLPDAVDLVVICVEAGMSLPAALARVASELNAAHPMLAAEFHIAQREIQMGCTTGEALKRLAERFDVAEVRSLASVIEQAEKFGASIVTALQVHADSLREKRYQQAEEKAQQAAVKLIVPTVFFIFPALFVVLLGPAMFDVFQLLQDVQMSVQNFGG